MRLRPPRDRRPPHRLTLQQAIDIVRAKNPTLLAGQLHVTATKANEITAGLRQNPSFTLLGSAISLSTENPAGPYTYSAKCDAAVRAGEKRRWRLDVTHSTTDVTQSRYKDTERQAILQVKQGFTNMSAAKGALKIAVDNVDSYRKTVELSKARRDAGDISETDFERIDLDWPNSSQITTAQSSM